MIEIYLKTNTNYDKNGDITLIPTSCLYKDSQKELVLQHTQDEEGRWEYIDFENVIAAEENGKKKLFRIYNVVKTLYNVTAYARPIFYDLVDNILLDVRPTSKTGEEALNIILEGTGFTGHSNITTLNTAYYVRKNIVEALLGDEENTFVNRWGGEFYCENFDVYINDVVGADNGVRVEFGYNLNEVEENINIENVVTRIIPLGFDGLTLEENWVDSPLILKYTKPKMRVVEFPDVKVKENEDDDGFETIEEARQELVNQCNKLFDEGVDLPTVNYKIDMINLANTTEYKDFKMLVDVGIGDTVTCYIKHLDIDVKARVVDYERDLITGEYTYLELGSITENFFNNQADVGSLIEQITNSDGTVKGATITGILNAVNVQMKAMRDIAQPQEVRAMICEDLDPDSPTYGAMCYGTMGFMIASERTLDGKDWNWSTFGTGKGFFADYIVAGTMLADRIKSGMLESLNSKSWINMEDGTFNFANKMKFIDNTFSLILNSGNSVEIEIEASAEGVTTNINKTLEDYSTTTEMNTAIKVSAEGVTTTVSKTYATQETTKNLQSQITQNAENISTKVSNDEYSTLFNQNAESFNYTIGTDGTNVKIDKDGIEVKNGGLTVVNSNGVTIIDGSSNIFKIQTAMEISIDAGSDLNYIYTLNHNLGCVPAYVAYQVDSVSDMGVSNTLLPAMSINSTTSGLGIGAIIRTNADSNNIYINYIRSTTDYTSSIKVKVFIYVERLL